MAMAIKIERQSGKLITPFAQTPPTLSSYKLGFIDEFVAAVDVGIVLFFSNNSNHNQNFVARLEESLGKTLARLYPLSGRYVGETHTIDCNDQGVEFIHANVNIILEDFLASEVNYKLVDEFIPSKLGAAHQLSGPILAAQVTIFECGGVAIGVCGTHKIVDASTLSTLINEWASTNQEQNEIKIAGFNSTFLFPARGLTSFQMPPMNEAILKKHTRIKLSFSESAISNMKAKGTNSTRQWSKVQLVSAILWKAFMFVDLAIHNYQRESVLFQAVNLREKMGSLIPKDSCGNLWGLCATECKTPETVEELADRLSDSVKKTITDFSKGFHNHEVGQQMVLNSLSCLANIHESTNVVVVTSWCKFPFYEADFGFGKPVWAAPGTIPLNPSAYLVDDIEGNGVEAYAFLEVKDAPYFKEAIEYDDTSFGASIS